MKTAFDLNFCPLHVQAMTGSHTKWLKAVSKLARHVSLEDGKMTFDEIGVLALPQKLPELLKEAGFTGVILEVLASFGAGLNTVFNNLLHTPEGLTGSDYEIDARVKLGFQAAVIFGTLSITPSLKQVVAYVPYYIDKAVSDGKLVGLPLTLKHFPDRTMETAHSEPKSGQFRFSGGRRGCISKTDHQELIITQLFYNELMRVENREAASSMVSSNCRHKRQLAKEEADPVKAKRVKVQLPFDESVVTEEHPEQDMSLEDPDRDDELQPSLTADEIISISKGKVREGSHEDISLLRSTLQERASKQTPYITSVDKIQAETLAKSIKNESTTVHHLQNVFISDTLAWSRQDSRVSKEVFVLKIYPSKKQCEFIIERKLCEATEKRKIIIPLPDIMGMAVSQNSIILDISKPPKMAKKNLQSRSQWIEDGGHVETKDSTKVTCTLTFVGEAPSSSFFERIPQLHNAIGQGIRSIYPQFKPNRELTPAEYIPVVKDPTLVRAMQLCILDLEAQCSDPATLVQMFSKFSTAFNDLLLERLNEAHEE